MDFREYAAKETAELASRLSQAAAAVAERAAGEVRAEAQRVADGLRHELETITQERVALAGSLQDAQAQIEQLHGDVKRAGERVETLTRQLEETSQSAQQLETERAAQATARQEAESQLQTARDTLESLRGELQAAKTQAEETAQQLADATRRLDETNGLLEEARRAHEASEAARAELTVAHDEHVNGRRAAEAELRTTRETVDSLRADLASAMTTLDKAAAERLASEEAAASAHRETQAAEAKLTAVTDMLKKDAAKVKALQQLLAERERQVQQLESKVQAAAQSGSTPASGAAPQAPLLEDLLAGFQALAGASTINEVLTTLVEQLAAQFPRVALFRVKKGHLQGEHQIGFDLQNDIGKLVLPLGMESLPSRAAGSGQIETLSGEQLKNNRTPFTGTPSHALALPMIVGGETLAIVYADDSGAPKRGRASAPTQARFAEAMQQYAVAVLRRLGQELKTLAELRKYAISLLHEIEQMYTADVESGMSGPELQTRLTGNLEYARSIYGSRTALESADAASLIEEELAAVIEAHAGSAFAHDLAAAAGHTRAAEAS